MGAEENAALVRRGYEAFGSGDMAALTELIAEDAVWHEAGHGGVSGVNQGRDAIFAHFGEEMARSGGTYTATLQDVIGGDERVVALHHDHAERDSKVLDQNVVVVFHIRDGCVSEAWEIPDDQPSRGEFFSLDSRG
jgi:ketosteroid isomerase-like protein